MTKDLDKILEDAQDNGIADEVKKQLLELKLENIDLKDKNKRLQIEQSNSRANQFKESNANLRAKNNVLASIDDELVILFDDGAAFADDLFDALNALGNAFKTAAV